MLSDDMNGTLFFYVIPQFLPPGSLSVIVKIFRLNVLSFGQKHAQVPGVLAPNLFEVRTEYNMKSISYR